MFLGGVKCPCCCCVRRYSKAQSDGWRESHRGLGLGITWSVVTGIPAPQVTSTSITVLAGPGHSIPHGAWAVDRCCWRYFFLKETVPFVIASNISTLPPPLQSDKQQRGEARVAVRKYLSTCPPPSLGTAWCLVI